MFCGKVWIKSFLPIKVFPIFSLLKIREFKVKVFIVPLIKFVLFNSFTYFICKLSLNKVPTPNARIIGTTIFIIYVPISFSLYILSVCFLFFITTTACLSESKEMSNLHTHNTHTHMWFVWGCKVLWLRREGRRDYEKGLRYGIKTNYMITLESREFSIFDIYYTSYSFILPQYKMKEIN